MEMEKEFISFKKFQEWFKENHLDRYLLSWSLESMLNWQKHFYQSQFNSQEINLNDLWIESSRLPSIKIALEKKFANYPLLTYFPKIEDRAKLNQKKASFFFEQLIEVNGSNPFIRAKNQLIRSHYLDSIVSLNDETCSKRPLKENSFYLDSLASLAGTLEINFCNALDYDDVSFRSDYLAENKIVKKLEDYSGIRYLDLGETMILFRQMNECQKTLMQHDVCLITSSMNLSSGKRINLINNHDVYSIIEHTPNCECHVRQKF